MRKETQIAVGVVAAVVVSILAWLVISTSSESEAPAPVVKSETVEFEAMELTEPQGSQSDEKISGEEDFLDEGDITRIIVVEPEGDEISDLLSEKIIRDGKIVDKE